MDEILQRKLVVEFVGMFLFVFTVGMATNKAGAGALAPLAIGSVLMVMVFAGGHVSGGHFNPAISLGAAVSGRLPWKDLPGYWISQVVGGLLAGVALVVVAKGKSGFSPVGHMAANGYGEHSPSHYSLGAVIIAEVLLTAFFLIVVLGATDDRAPKGFGPLAIGLSLTLIHLVSIPISNTSVNPARSTGVAFFNGDGAPGQLWVFWLAPLIGGLIGGLIYPLLFESGKLAIGKTTP